MVENNSLIMPKAVATWLIQNTKLSFVQIAEFCNLHLIEIQHLADGSSVTPVDPILTTFELTKEEVEKCEKDPQKKLSLQSFAYNTTDTKSKIRHRKYIPIANRQNKPNAILWLIQHETTIKDVDIKKMIGTTKETIEKIRNKTYKGYANLVPKNPVSVNLCTQDELDSAMQKAVK